MGITAYAWKRFHSLPIENLRSIIRTTRQTLESQVFVGRGLESGPWRKGNVLGSWRPYPNERFETAGAGGHGQVQILTFA